MIYRVLQTECYELRRCGDFRKIQRAYGPTGPILSRFGQEEREMLRCILRDLHRHLVFDFQPTNISMARENGGRESECEREREEIVYVRETSIVSFGSKRVDP